MSIDRELLKCFKELEITRRELFSNISEDIKTDRVMKPVVVTNSDVINLLRAFSNEKINKTTLLEWVNTVWFSGLYEYSDEYCDSIASVMNVLEELDEGKVDLTQKQIDKYIQALENNTEV